VIHGSPDCFKGTIPQYTGVIICGIQLADYDSFIIRL
jgi:hypothetical protein